MAGVSLNKRADDLPKWEKLIWTRPEFGWFKLQTAGCVWPSGMATAGGILTDQNGKWVFGFAKKLGQVPIATAQLLALQEGLTQAWERRTPNIKVKTDVDDIVNLFEARNLEEHPLGSMIEECRAFAHKPWVLRISQTFTDGFSVADVLASYGQSMGDDFQLWEEPPLELFYC